MSTNAPAKTSKHQYLLPFALVTSLFFLWGFARAILDVLNKHFQDTLQVGITESAMIQVVTYMGYFLMAIPAGIFINRFGYRRGVVFGLVLFAVGAFLFIPCMGLHTLTAFLGCLFIIACGLAFLETSANPYATELGPKEHATSRLNLAQSFNGMGSFLAPLIVGGLLFSQGSQANVSLPYLVMGIVVVVIAIVFSLVKLPEITVENNEESVQGSAVGNIRALLSKPLFLLGLAALLAYEVAEISINSYFVNFTTGMGWLTAANASYILSLALVVFMIGRFIGSGLMMLMSAERMLWLCATGSIVSIAAMIGTGLYNDPAHPWIGHISLGCLIANYLFESIMFPTIFSLVLRGLGGLTKTGSSLLMMTPVGGCGFLLVAWVADHSNPIVPFFIPLLGFVVVWVFAHRRLAQNR